MAFISIEKHRDYHSKYGRELRSKLRAEGRCTGCGKEPKAGKNYCAKCAFRCSVNSKNLSRVEKNRAWELYESFDGKCQCCGTAESGRRGFCLDHKNGRVRGIICSKCNVAMGYLRDSPAIAIKAAEYLQRTGDGPV